MSGNALHQVADNKYKLTFDPFGFMAHRMAKDGFDIDFSAWIVKFDEQGDLLCKSDFNAPHDKSYAHSSQASSMVRMVENGESWAMFSYSDSLYQIKDCEVVKRIKLPSLSPITYFLINMKVTIIKDLGKGRKMVLLITDWSTTNLPG